MDCGNIKEIDNSTRFRDMIMTGVVEGQSQVEEDYWDDYFRRLDEMTQETEIADVIRDDRSDFIANKTPT